MERDSIENFGIGDDGIIQKNCGNETVFECIILKMMNLMYFIRILIGKLISGDRE